MFLFDVSVDRTQSRGGAQKEEKKTQIVRKYLREHEQCSLTKKSIKRLVTLEFE